MLPEACGTKYQVMFRASASEGEPWMRVLRRASSEEKARKIFAHAEAALDIQQGTPVGADVARRERSGCSMRSTSRICSSAAGNRGR